MSADQDFFDRSWRVRIGTLDVSDLDLDFSIKKTKKREPNTGTITMYGTSEKTRRLLSMPSALDVALEAGYAGRTSLIYSGQMRGAPTTIEQPDIVTVIETGDSEEEIRKARLSVPVGPTVPIDQVLKEIAKALGVKIGNTAQLAAKIKAKGVALYPVPSRLTGNGFAACDIFAKSAGLEWSIQDGALQFIDRGGALDAKPYVLSAASGLIDSPSIDKKGIVNATTFILPDLRPGLRVVFDSRFVKGTFVVDECSYEGSTYGGSWYNELVCSKQAVT